MTSSNNHLPQAIAELKGYVDACVNAYEGEDRSVPWSMMETIQKNVDTIVQQVQEGF